VGADTPPSAGPRLSVLLVVHNEERRLAECLATARFADEIVVVLDRCTDRSAEIARDHGARLVEGAWPIEGDRRNAGLAACTGDWVLELDADERVMPELAAEIRRRIVGAPPGRLAIHFDNRIGGRPVRHGWGAYNGVAQKDCLFPRGTKSWGRERVHPSLVWADAVRERREVLDARLIHHVYADIADMVAKLNRYSTLAAEDAVDAGRVLPLPSNLRRIPSRFWKSYVARGGWREGDLGIALGLFSALYPILTCLKARAMARDRSPTSVD
jgi:glycosyltransferase involved in cell wall biosynthesis